MDYPIREVVRSTGVTSRALRHYHRLGLLRPSSTSASGERHYDEVALMRLQRLLLLRDVGLPLDRIRAVLDREADREEALMEHVETLRAERARLAKQITAVEATITALREKRKPSMNQMFEGFNHDRYTGEVQRRWGSAVAREAQDWWNGLDDSSRRDAQTEVAELSRAWAHAADAKEDPQGAVAQQLADRHIRWLASMPSTPAAQAAQTLREAQEALGTPDVQDTQVESPAQADTAINDAESTLRAYVLGLADTYVADPRFASNYGGLPGASFVRASLRSYFGED